MNKEPSLDGRSSASVILFAVTKQYNKFDILWSCIHHWRTAIIFSWCFVKFPPPKSWACRHVFAAVRNKTPEERREYCDDNSQSRSAPLSSWSSCLIQIDYQGIIHFRADFSFLKQEKVMTEWKWKHPWQGEMSSD